MKINVPICACLLLFPVAGLAQPAQKTGPAIADASAGVLKIAAKDDTSLMWLAHIWSGGQAEARCRYTIDHGRFLLPGERYCELFGGARGVVGLQLNVDSSIQLLTWDRPTLGHPDAQVITDSLDILLRSHGLTSRQCDKGIIPDGEVEGALWESPVLLVQLSRITLNGRLPKLMVMAVDIPAAYPAALCRSPKNSTSPST